MTKTAKSGDAGKRPARIAGGGSRRKPVSTRSRRARRDRGAETRARLIAAALDIFGRKGFEGASTREIATAAGANLAAIAYHFGSKEALHIAVAEHIAAGIRSRIEAVLVAAAQTQDSRDDARAMLHRMIATYVGVLLDNDGAEDWARFLVREQMQPSAAFDVIYRVMGGSVAIVNRLLAAVLGGSPTDENIRIRSFAIFGQVLVFRAAHALVLRHMGWPSIGPRDRARIREVVAVQLDAILDSAGRA